MGLEQINELIPEAFEYIAKALKNSMAPKPHYYEWEDYFDFGVSIGGGNLDTIIEYYKSQGNSSQLW
jgi:hypothetical protein